MSGVDHCAEQPTCLVSGENEFAVRVLDFFVGIERGFVTEAGSAAPSSMHFFIDKAAGIPQYLGCDQVSPLQVGLARSQ